MSTNRLVWSSMVVVLLLAGAAVAAQTTFTASPILFTGQVGIGPGIGTPYPLARLDGNGDTNTRIRIDGSKTTGIYFTRRGADGGTIRGTSNGVGGWKSHNARV